MSIDAAMNQGHLYSFEGLDFELKLVPLAVRRLLDGLGRKLSLEGWTSLSSADRRELLRLGSASVVDGDSALIIIQRAHPSPREIVPSQDPPVDSVPRKVTDLLGDDHPLPLQLWVILSPLERWVLNKLAHGKHPERVTVAYAEIMAATSPLTHINRRGEAHMVATTEKPRTHRRAVAVSRVTVSKEAYRALVNGDARKGDVLATARIAGIMAAKQTSQLIPLCHPLDLTHVELDLVASTEFTGVELRAEVVAVDRTGVEMEAMVAVSIAALTVYDMLKAVDRSMAIGPTRLVAKSGGKSGDYLG